MGGAGTCADVLMNDVLMGLARLFNRRGTQSFFS